MTADENTLRLATGELTCFVTLLCVCVCSGCQLIYVNKRLKQKDSIDLPNRTVATCHVPAWLPAAHVDAFLDSLPSVSGTAAAWNVPLQRQNEALVVPTQVGRRGARCQAWRACLGLPEWMCSWADTCCSCRPPASLVYVHLL